MSQHITGDVMRGAETGCAWRACSEGSKDTARIATGSVVPTLQSCLRAGNRISGDPQDSSGMGGCPGEVVCPH